MLSKLNTGFFLPQIATILFLKCRPPFFCLCPQNLVSPCQTNVNLERLWNNNVEKSKTAQITTYKNNMGLEQLASIARTSLCSKKMAKKEGDDKGQQKKYRKKIKYQALRTKRSQAKDKTSAYTMFKNVSDKTVQLTTA